MIRSFRHKGLERFFLENDPRGIRFDLARRCRRRLLTIHRAPNLQGINLPGLKLHSLRGPEKRFTVHVNGPWCITFEWRDGDAWSVDLEQYH